MRLWGGHPGLGPNLRVEKQRSMPPGSTAVHFTGPAYLSLIVNPTGRKIDKYLSSSSEPPLLCMCIQKKMLPKQAIWAWEDALNSLPGNKHA